MNVSASRPSGIASLQPREVQATAWLMLAILGIAEFFGMTLWFSATAVTPMLVAHFQMPAEHAAWLTMAVQAGFVVGTLVSAIANLADVLSARVLFFAGALGGAVMTAAVPSAPTAATVILLRFLTGVALACVYPPGMKIAAGWFRDRRGFALGVLIGALTFGKAFPHLLTALYGEDWRAPLYFAAVLALAGGILVLLVVRDGPFVTVTSRFDPHAVWKIVRTRGARLATFGYLGHMWELYAMWTWIAVLAAASFTVSGRRDAASAGSLVAFVAIASGTAGCVLAGWLADRVGRARVAIWAMWTSAACAALTALAFGRSPIWFFALAAVWGFAVVADSAQFSALVSEYSPIDHVGTALTLQTSLGFLLTLVTIEAMPRVAAIVGWQWTSWLLVPGPLLGIVAMKRLDRHA